MSKPLTRFFASGTIYCADKGYFLPLLYRSLTMPALVSISHKSVESHVLRMFTRFLKFISKGARTLFPLLICSGLFCYFTLHISKGDYGLEAKEQLKVRVLELQSVLAQLTKQRKFYEQRIELLKEGQAQKDTADELARKLLYYAAPGDLVLFE